jgi:PAS domain S-box-containing protein
MPHLSDTASGSRGGIVEARRQEALLKTGALQDAIFNSAYFSSIATDEKGVIQIFNVGAERMLGYTALDVVNRITPADISDPQELIARAAALSMELNTPIAPGFEALVFKASRGIEDIYELTYVRKDGSRFAAMVSVTALRDAQDEVIGYLLIGTDNTARKHVEAAQALLDQQLRDQQFYTRSLIESNIDALMMTDPSGIISDVNEQMIALTGRARSELIGAPCKNFFTNPVEADAAISRVLLENRVNNYELTVRAKNGVETVVSYNAATFHDRDGKLQGVFAAARDVTERKRFEGELQEKNIELVHASRMKSEFLATMSHELRTPLNSIIGFSEALKDGLVGPMSDPQTEYVGDIFDSGQHLLSLINDILDLSKVEAGMMTLELEAVDLGKLMSNSLSIVREKAAAQQIRLQFELGEGLEDTELDVRKTKQIVYNLLSNAVKFSANGGCVTLSARRVPRSCVGRMQGLWPVHVYPWTDGGAEEFVELCVSDTGIGVSREDMRRLFQAFCQIDSSLARKFEGTGLGLAMVKQLAELHGGAVALASAPGEGAKFAVWLPLLTSHRMTASLSPTRVRQPTPVLPPSPLSGDRVAMIVEDDERAAELVRLLLEAEGFTVLHCASAEAALLLAPQHQLSLITLDIQLPGMSGWQFLQKLREIDSAASVPVVIIAGLIDVAMASTGGAAALLQKPVSRAQLRGSLVSLGLEAASAQTHSILVVDHQAGRAAPIAAVLPAPSYDVVRAFGGSEAIKLAQEVKPDLILVDPALPSADSSEVVDALQEHSATALIPILVMAGEQDGVLVAKATLDSASIAATSNHPASDQSGVVAASHHAMASTSGVPAWPES